MGGRISMETSGSTPMLVKRAEGTVARSRLAHEAEALAAIGHPGVVRLVEYRTGDDHDELITEFAGATTLADHRPRTVAAVAGIGAAIADTVADLQDMGLAHGGLQADHIIFGARRRPILCSFSEASSGHDAMADDVAALGRLVSELLQGISPARVGADRRARATVADAAADASAGTCSARSLAARLAAVRGATIDADAPPESPGAPPESPDAPPESPGADLVSGGLDGTRTWRHRVAPTGAEPHRPDRWAVITVGAALGVLVLVLVATSGLRRDVNVESGREGVTMPTTTPTTTSTAVFTPAPVSAVASTPSATSSSTVAVAPPSSTPSLDLTRPVADCPTGLDVDADGCGDDTEVVGGLIRHGRTWYQVGQPGDVVVLGHWSCAPVATPAVLRPATGELFVFDRWPSPEAPVRVTGSSVALPGASTVVRGEVDGCDAPVVEAP